jgi:excisionase family DNA binding protein
MSKLLSHALESITLFRLSQGTINLQLIAEVNMDTLLSVEEAAKRLGGISKWTVHAWLSKGRLPPRRTGKAGKQAKSAREGTCGAANLKPARLIDGLG